MTSMQSERSPLNAEEVAESMKMVHELWPHAIAKVERPDRIDFYSVLDDVPVATVHIPSGRVTVLKREPDAQFMSSYPGIVLRKS